MHLSNNNFSCLGKIPIAFPNSEQNQFKAIIWGACLALYYLYLKQKKNKTKQTNQTKSAVVMKQF